MRTENVRIQTETLPGCPIGLRRCAADAAGGFESSSCPPGVIASGYGKRCDPPTVAPRARARNKTAVRGVVCTKGLC